MDDIDNLITAAKAKINDALRVKQEAARRDEKRMAALIAQADDEARRLADVLKEFEGIPIVQPGRAVKVSVDSARPNGVNAKARVSLGDGEGEAIGFSVLVTDDGAEFIHDLRGFPLKPLSAPEIIALCGNWIAARVCEAAPPKPEWVAAEETDAPF